MIIDVDERYGELGIRTVAGCILEEVDVSAEMTQPLEELFSQRAVRALLVSEEELKENRVLEGYRNMIRRAGRSLKKYPPTAEALIRNIQSRRTLSRINSVVDIYNMETIYNYLSIGAHDLDKVSGPICFTFSEGEEAFYPIGGGEKKTVKGDFLYRDEAGILAHLDARDSELYKISAESKRMILIVQGNADTSLEYRKEALEKICTAIITCCGGVWRFFSAECGERTEV